MLFLSLLLPLLVRAQSSIAFDNKSGAGSGGSVASISWPHTINSSTNGILLVGVSTFFGNTVSGITFNGNALTFIGSTTSFGSAHSELWYIKGQSGTHNIVVTLSASDDVACGAQSFTGVNQTTPFIATHKNSANNTTGAISVSVTSKAGEYVVDNVALTGSSPTVNAAQTQEYNTPCNLNSDYGAGSYEYSSASSVTMQWTNSSPPFGWAIVAVSLNPASGLPIKLLSFDASLSTNQTVFLNWATASETNNHFFTIEKTQDGNNWTIVGITPGAGNSVFTHYYSTVDDNPFTGVSYYRLKQTDYDGAYSFSPVVPIQYQPSDFFKIRTVNTNNGISATICSQSSTPCNIELEDITGKILYEKNI